jgi:hypothetical protein
MPPLTRTAFLAGLLGLTVAACGGSSGASKLSVTVTQDFGRSSVAPTRSAPFAGDLTAIGLLQSQFTVKAGADSVQEVEGVSGGEADGQRVGWFSFVNGVEADKPGKDKLSSGDHVWWDRHDSSAAKSIAAVVGAFPEPFEDGIDGKKLPVRLVCMGDVQRSCTEVEQRLQAAGIKDLARSSLEQSPGEVLRILVGPWTEVRKDIAARTLEEGPGTSGVFAKPDPSGGKLSLLDATGKTVRTLGPASGLVAATSYADQQPTWLVTGTDDVGVAAAAAAISADQLHDHFALAIEAGEGVGLPLQTP